MICLRGTRVCGGMTSGRAYVLRKSGVARETGGTRFVPDELRRLELAIGGVCDELRDAAARAETGAAREILEIHRMMLEDEDVLASLRDAAQSGLSAESAVAQTEDRFVRMLLDTRDDTMAARADDVRDVCGRLSARLSGSEDDAAPREPFILAADDLLPGDLLRFDRKNLLGVVMRTGALRSHVSILIREMGIPAVICGDMRGVETDMRVLLDGDRGRVCFAPDEAAEAAFARDMRLRAEENARAPLRDLPCALMINVGNAREAVEALTQPCGGVGLFRTEFLYIGRSDLPDEEEQYQAYSAVLRAAKDRPVTVRTFDLGADKQSAALPIGPEENPALGLRGLRVYSVYPEVFQTQLRALLRAAVCGNLQIMVPMVTSCAEIAEIRRQIDLAAEALAARGSAYRIPPLGAMIETPAAVMISSELAGLVDFFSVGTNDLTQYTYALDRQRVQSEPNLDALLRLIAIAAENAHSAGIPICVCGELAADPDLTREWAKMRIDSLSVAPGILKSFLRASPV